MKTYIILLLITLNSINTLKAQGVYAKLEKNKNVRAESLLHELNKTKDTLLLKSDSKITHVYSINSDYKREIDVYMYENQFRVPLNKLTKGKHVMVVGQSPKKIIFVIHIFLDDKDISTSVKEVKVTYTSN